MFTYNITFIVEPKKETELIDYIKNRLLPLLFNSESPATNPHLKKVVEAGGDKPDENHGLSIALAASFETEEKAHFWNDHILLPSLGDFHLKFGVNGLFFVTLLETLEI